MQQCDFYNNVTWSTENLLDDVYLKLMAIHASCLHLHGYVTRLGYVP